MKPILLLLVTLVIFAAPSLAQAQEAQPTLEERVTRLESREKRLTYEVNRFQSGVGVFLFGAFSALWAQNTRRNPWLWFFLGLFFNVITVLVLLYKNAEERSAQAS